MNDGQSQSGGNFLRNQELTNGSTNFKVNEIEVFKVNFNWSK